MEINDLLMIPDGTIAFYVYKSKAFLVAYLKMVVDNCHLAFLRNNIVRKVIYLLQEIHQPRE